MTESVSFSRRRFLQGTGWVAGGITVFGVTGCALVPPLPTFGVSDDEDIFTWVQLLPTGDVRFYLPRAELGQGIATGLSQVVAEELAMDLDRIECRYQSTAVMAPCQMTVGSESIENYLRLTARSAAFLRETLRRRAALRFGSSEIVLGDAGFIVPEQGLVPYSDLLAADEVAVIALPEFEAVELLIDRRDRPGRVVGRRVKPMHIERIVQGEEIYSRDVRLPDMHYGTIARPAQLGAELRGFDREAALAVTGVHAVVEHDGQVGIVARTPMAAERGLAALAPDWKPLTGEALAFAQTSLDIDSYLADAGLDHAANRQGSLEAAS